MLKSLREIANSLVYLLCKFILFFFHSARHPHSWQCKTWKGFFSFLFKNWKRKKNTGYHLPLQISCVCVCASEHEATDFPVKSNTQTRQQYSTLQQGTDSNGNVTTHARVPSVRGRGCRTARARDALPALTSQEKFLAPGSSAGCPTSNWDVHRWVCRIMPAPWIKKKKCTKQVYGTLTAPSCLYLCGGKAAVAAPKSSFRHWTPAPTEPETQKSQNKVQKKRKFISTVTFIIFLKKKRPQTPSQISRQEKGEGGRKGE